MRKESESNQFICVICHENSNFYSIGSCEHKGVCNICTMRSRILYKDLKCPICTQKFDYVFVCEVEDPLTFAKADEQKQYMYKDDNFQVKYFFTNNFFFLS
jgi:hypothetical protein